MMLDWAYPSRGDHLTNTRFQVEDVGYRLRSFISPSMEEVAHLPYKAVYDFPYIPQAWPAWALSGAITT